EYNNTRRSNTFSNIKQQPQQTSPCASQGQNQNHREVVSNIRNRVHRLEQTQSISRRLVGDLLSRRLQLRPGFSTMLHKGIFNCLRQVTIKVEQGSKGRNSDVGERSLEHGNELSNGIFGELLAFINDAHALTGQPLCHLCDRHCPLIGT
uniref:Uncharacterized protein n=1 Tax=Triticum urartu TaxID=4572 RepID=A0A8R7JYR5_TRIUA